MSMMPIFPSDRDHFVYDGKGGTIVVGFTSNEYYPTIKERQFTEIDFFSYLGGTLGLFAGFSVLTAFEVLSHIILPFCSKWLKGKRRPKVFPVLRPVQVKIKTRRSKVRRIVAVPSKFCYSYVENSSLHGVSHAALENMGWFAKVLWLTLFAVSIGFCSVLLTETLQKYQQGLIVLSLDDQFHKIQSVSVCFCQGFISGFKFKIFFCKILHSAAVCVKKKSKFAQCFRYRFQLSQLRTALKD